MELALLRSLMDKEFYDEHRGAKCPDRLFSKDVRKIKSAIDTAMERYERSVMPEEREERGREKKKKRNPKSEKRKTARRAPRRKKKRRRRKKRSRGV